LLTANKNGWGGGGKDKWQQHTLLLINVSLLSQQPNALHILKKVIFFFWHQISTDNKRIHHSVKN
jgi:hypothetical protein